MRIGLLTQWYSPEPGPASLPAGLARGLVERGHEVRVVTGFPNYPTGRVADGYRMRRRADEVVDGARVRRVALYPSHDTSAAKRALNYGSFAASALASGMDVLDDVDALWVNYSPVTIGLPMLWQRRRRRTPILLHVLDLWPDTVTASGVGGAVGPRLESALHRWCHRLYEASDKVAFISPGVGAVLEARGVAPQRLAYAPMWADESVHAPTPSPIERAWGLGQDTVALVYAGTLGGAQDLTSLVQACARLRHLDFRCLVAGSGTMESGLRSMAKQVGASNVTFLGRVDAGGVRDLTAASDLHYVGLSDHPLAGVTMPSKIQAILASARPLLGSCTGDAADVVRRSGGWAVEPGDVDSLADSLALAIALGRDGLATRRGTARDLYDAEFGFERGVERIEHLLREVAGAVPR